LLLEIVEHCMLSFYWLVIGILVVWRVTHLLAVESGPIDVIGKARRLAGTGLFGELVSCFYCLSVWIAAPLACLLADNWKHRLLLWPALSAGAILLERVTSAGQQSEPVILQDAEDSHVLRS
jgi:hypothetical protein